MPKFNKAKNKLSIDPKKIEEFAKGAEKRTLISDNSESWQSFDKDARPTKGLNLRLNDYELELIRYLAKKEDRSTQKIIKRLLIPALEQQASQM